MKDVSLVIGAGEVVVRPVPTGSGTTTLLDILVVGADFRRGHEPRTGGKKVGHDGIPHMSVASRRSGGNAARRSGRHVHELSGGQHQRVALERAIVVGPEVYFLEGLLGVHDLDLKRQMHEEPLHARTTFAHMTHDQDGVLAII